MGPELHDLFSKVVNDIRLWAAESRFRSLLVLFLFVVIGVPAISYLQFLVRTFPYITFVGNIIGWFEVNFSIRDYCYSITLLVFGVGLFWMYRQIRKSDIIADDFNDGLMKWSWPLNAGWTVQKCDDVSGKMLSITNSHYPGTLKGASVWYDYEITFEAKLLSEEKSKIGFVVRSENSLNGVMLQITHSRLIPHLLYSGKYILDTPQQLSTPLPIGKWEKFRVVVMGNNIELYLYNHIIRYSIPTKVLNIADDKYNKHGDLQLKDLEISDQEIENSQRNALSILDKLKGKNDDQRKQIFTEFNSAMDAIPKYTTITLEFQKGAVGFRASGEEKIGIRNFLIRKIH